MVKVSIPALTSLIQGCVMKEGYSAGQSDVVKRGKGECDVAIGQSDVVGISIASEWV